MYKKDKFRCGVYKITSPSNKSYIGSSINITKRWWEHKHLLSTGKHPNPILQKAWDKYDGDLKFQQLLICRPEDLLMYEQLLLDRLKPEYNVAIVAGSPMRGRKASAEIKHKMSLARTGKKMSEKAREALRQSKLGKPLSAAHKLAISETLKAKYRTN